MMQKDDANHHYNPYAVCPAFFAPKRPPDTETQLGRQLHAEFTWNKKTEIA